MAALEFSGWIVGAAFGSENRCPLLIYQRNRGLIQFNDAAEILNNLPCRVNEMDFRRFELSLPHMLDNFLEHLTDPARKAVQMKIAEENEEAARGVPPVLSSLASTSPGSQHQPGGIWSCGMAARSGIGPNFDDEMALFSFTSSAGFHEARVQRVLYGTDKEHDWKDLNSSGHDEMHAATMPSTPESMLTSKAKPAKQRQFDLSDDDDLLSPLSLKPTSSMASTDVVTVHSRYCRGIVVNHDMSFIVAVLQALYHIPIVYRVNTHFTLLIAELTECSR